MKSALRPGGASRKESAAALSGVFRQVFDILRLALQVGEFPPPEIRSTPLRAKQAAAPIGFLAGAPGGVMQVAHGPQGFNKPRLRIIVFGKGVVALQKQFELGPGRRQAVRQQHP